MMPELTGSWIGYAETMKMLGKRYHPRTVLELGSGYFIAAHAIASSREMAKYIGIDKRVYSGQIEDFRKSYPTIEIIVHDGTDIHDRRLAKLLEPYAPVDMLLIDAHDGDARQWAKDTLAQLRMVSVVKPRVVVIDDCAVPEIQNVAYRGLGTPTGHDGKSTDVSWWEV